MSPTPGRAGCTSGRCRLWVGRRGRAVRRLESRDGLPGNIMPESSRVIPANEYRRVRWKNGLGWTREIVRVPDNDDWDWRLSIAEIERDAAFSSFPGIDRELVLLRGNGLRNDLLPSSQQGRTGRKESDGQSLRQRCVCP